MAFGMCNAPATFQRLGNTVLSSITNCNAHLDDLIVYSTTWEEHIAVLIEVFTWLANASLTLNVAKCKFGKATVTYLGRAKYDLLMQKLLIYLHFLSPQLERCCVAFWIWLVTIGIFVAISLLLSIL